MNARTRTRRNTLRTAVTTSRALSYRPSPASSPQPSKPDASSRPGTFWSGSAAAS